MINIGADAAKLAGLQIDALTKFRSGQLSLDHFERFLNLSPEAREDRFGTKGRVIASQPDIIQINRGSFNPAEFIGQGWEIIPEETDERSIALTEFDLSKISQVTMLGTKETSVKGETKLKRLKESDYTRLDLDIFFTLWENKHLIPESWKEKVNGNTRYIFFDGQVLRHPRGLRYVLCLYWRDGGWYWYYVWLGSVWFAGNPSAVLAS